MAVRSVEPTLSLQRTTSRIGLVAAGGAHALTIDLSWLGLAELETWTCRTTVSRNGLVHEAVGELMGRRIRWLGAIMVASFGLAIAQLVNIQVVKAPALRASASNPRNEGEQYNNQRGDIYASDGTLLAESVRSSEGAYHYVRDIPAGLAVFASGRVFLALLRDRRHRESLQQLPREPRGARADVVPSHRAFSSSNVEGQLDPHHRSKSSERRQGPRWARSLGRTRTPR